MRTYQKCTHFYRRTFGWLLTVVISATFGFGAQASVLRTSGEWSAYSVLEQHCPEAGWCSFGIVDHDADIDINGDSVTDFRLLSRGEAMMEGFMYWGTVSIQAMPGNAIAQSGGINSGPDWFNVGQTLGSGSGLNWVSSAVVAGGESLSSGWSGHDEPSLPSYIAIKFGDHYGWMKVLGFDPLGMGLDIGELAYESLPGAPITVGSAVPLPPSVFLFALGFLFAVRGCYRGVPFNPPRTFSNVASV